MTTPGGEPTRRGFLADVHQADQSVVLRYTQARLYAPGDFAVHRGELDRSFFIISRGSFEVLAPSDAGHQPVRVLEPIGFCNPTRKAHAGAVFGVKNADAHLACYVTTPSQFPGIAVNIANQFVKRPIRVLKPDILCVPSLKLQWAPVLGVTANPGASGTPVEETPEQP